MRQITSLCQSSYTHTTQEMMSILKGVGFIVCLAIETDINRDFSTAHCRSSSGDSREIKIHGYGKRQTSD